MAARIDHAQVHQALHRNQRRQAALTPVERSLGCGASHRRADDPLGNQMNDFRKLDTPRGDGARSMTTMSPTSISVNFDQTGQDWFGPRTPMLPVAPPEIAGRSLDFLPGHNLVTEARADQPVTLAM